METTSRNTMKASRIQQLIKKGIKNPSAAYSYIIRELQERNHLRTATNVYEREWDLLVLLDCATIEMMREIEAEYEFINEIGHNVSVGTCSNQWMKNTFTPEYRNEMESTLHVTANTSSEAYLSEKEFLHLEEVWKDGWNENLGTIPAKKVTDRIIYFMRKMDPKQAIVHYMQPHLPFVTESDIQSNVVTPMGVKGEGKNLEELHKIDAYGRDELWEASIDNLRYVLDEVEVLLSNVDAERVIISSDHGQAFGENGIWSHPCRKYIDVLKNVPWCPTTAVDRGGYETQFTEKRDKSDQDVSLDDKLEALGYK